MTGTKYLVDTGAFCSVFPASRHETCTIATDPIRLTAANGSSIPSHGTRDIRLHFGGRTYTWNFRLAQVTQPLLSADFLAHHHLLVDIAAPEDYYVHVTTRSLHKEHSTREHSIQQTKHCVLIGKLDYCTVFLLVGSILQTKNCILIG